MIVKSASLDFNLGDLNKPIVFVYESQEGISTEVVAEYRWCDYEIGSPGELWDIAEKEHPDINAVRLVITNVIPKNGESVKSLAFRLANMPISSKEDWSIDNEG